jgi:hypothetical protein
MHKTITLSGRALLATRRSMFAASPVDLSMLVVADALKRKAQAEIQRDALRDALYEMPPTSGQNEAWRNDRDRDGGAGRHVERDDID